MRIRSAILAALFFQLLTPNSAVADDELYDASDRLVRSTDSEGVTSYYVYNDDGELIETRKSDETVTVHESDSTTNRSGRRRE